MECRLCQSRLLLWYVPFCPKSLVFGCSTSSDPQLLDFNISAPAFSDAVPAFKAYCSGFGEGAPYDECEILDDSENIHQVAARLQAVNQTGTGAHLAVSYEFVDPTAE